MYVPRYAAGFSVPPRANSSVPIPAHIFKNNNATNNGSDDRSRNDGGTRVGERLQL